LPRIFIENFKNYKNFNHEKIDNHNSATVIWFDIQSVCRGSEKRTAGEFITSEIHDAITESGEL
jgi:hypothetical protein